MAQSSSKLDTSTVESTDADMSASHDLYDDESRGTLQRKLAILEESSYGSSEDFTTNEMDYSTPDDNTQRSNSVASTVTSHALTVIGIPRHILASKWLVAAILVGSTCVLGYFTYTYTNGEQEQDFKDQFADYSGELVDQSRNNLINTLAVVASFSKTITSLALFANTSWPLFSVPHFETRASDFLLLSKAQQVALAPMVSDDHREAWEAYAVENQYWIQEGLDFEYMMASSASYALLLSEDNTEGNQSAPVEPQVAQPIQETIWRYDANTKSPVVDLSKGPHLPVWQTYPAPTSEYVVNLNLLSTSEFQELQQVASRDRNAVLSGVMDDILMMESATQNVNPRSVILQPVFASFDDGAPVVAHLVVSMTWDIIFKDVLHDGAEPILCVLHACGQVYTYEVVGQEVNFLGEGDYHDAKYESLGVTSDFAGEASLFLTSLCNYTLHIYPTKTLEDASYNDMPAYITLAVVGMFAFTTLIFLLYDLLVQRQQSTLAATAMKTTAILGQLFPQEVHDRLFKTALADDNANSAPKFRMRKMVHEEDKHKPHNNNDNDGEKKQKDAPIADLFPECTVMFCDISGFTAWSSVREPCQVFELLETVYNAFDAIANRRGVFKVETIGDSYLAVTGLPTPREDHAVVMVKFASDCLNKMGELTQTLELELGPGTAELAMRFGLHSGPVTAGVLRGEKTRFQLFGDTVNTASRMESTGERDKIQVSQETADLLITAGRERWIKPRDTKIMAKGKGELQTYWANPRVQLGAHDSLGALPNSTNHSTSGGRPKMTPSSMVSTRMLHGTIACASGLDDRKKRSVHWVSEMMVKLLKQILARRAVSGWNIKKMRHDNDSTSQHLIAKGKDLVVDELQDIITLPKFDKNLARKQADSSKVKLPDPALAQLHSYIAAVALMYRDNPFHNIDHAAHVCMSTIKLLARIVAPETLDPAKENGRTFEARRHDHTYGITSDPLTQFACVFAALIHDADHPGCPNASLVKEKTELALKYQNKSVAEQNSFDLCWDMLMEDKYKDLRACIYATEEEGKRFRQLVVNSIIATDISDKNLSAQRKARWNKAFDESADQFEDESGGKSLEELGQEAINRKATIVIEHLIQASDVAHTMQHWHIYMKWNEKLFQEMQKAYEDGKIEKDPADSWYEGELGFYDFYIIPLAKKLKECGVFGVSSAEYLNYATANRQEWEVRGKEVVAGYVKKYGKRPTLPRNPSMRKRPSIVQRVLSNGESRDKTS